MNRRATTTARIPAQATSSPLQAHQPDALRLLLTVEEAGAALGVGRSLMYELIARGEIQTVRVGRLRRVRPDDLRDYVTSLTE
ncbi:excisionase family DNA-binding protein [Sporichthya polymorpha]|uniref:excisionase family DNA-binding protein n=1 Tax=Sporichthya polymorpha TaxID=35751 RepID=UPI0003793425|nr:excisionase family DNA-binding protein [Sporichthya polymorpha]